MVLVSEDGKEGGKFSEGQEVVAISKLLIEEYPLQVLPSLAVKIGLNEAIVLQQIHYWITVSGNKKDGRFWIYNTYDAWVEQFPFWSKSTIRRIIDNLEKSGLLITGNYNKAKFDRTRWYTIDYEKVNELGVVSSA